MHYVKHIFGQCCFFINFERHNLQQYTDESAFWNFCAIGNVATRFYYFTIAAIKELQQTLQWNLNNGTAILESRVKLMADAAVESNMVSADGSETANAADVNVAWVSEAVNLITQYTEESGKMVSNAWRDRLPTFFETYRDGQIFVLNGTAITRKSMFYPMWWLDLVGYWKIGGNPHGILFDADPIGFAPPKSASILTAPNVFAAIGVVVLGFAAGRYSSVVNRRKSYIPL